MKIAFIHNLPFGGGNRMINSIIDRYKSSNDIELFVIGTKNYKEISGITNRFYKIKPWRGFLPYNLWIILVLPFIHKKIAENEDWSSFDCIFFSHDYFSKSPYLLKFINNKRKYYLCQESQREFYESSKYHAPTIKEKIANLLRYPIKIIDRNNVSHANILFCNSIYSKKTLGKIYNREFKVIYPGVDEKYFTPSRVKKENLILCVGGINRVKNQEFIIKSLDPILCKYLLVLVGDGKQKYKNKILNLNKNIKIISNINDEELIALYRKSKLTCIGAYKEPFGLSSIESQACGTPVVSLNEGGPKETIINEETGYLCSRTKNDFLTKVKMAIKNNKNLGKNAVVNVKKYWTWDITLKPLDKYFLK